MNRIPVSPLISRGLEIAQQRLGTDELCKRLGAPAALIQAWQFGYTPMPENKFLELVDVLTGLDPNWAEGIQRAGAQALKRILIVDDHPDAADTLAAVLVWRGYRAQAVSDPREAIAAAKDFAPDIAILDLAMPHVSGLALAQVFRGDRQLKNVYLIALTAFGDQSIRERASTAGFDAYLVKPVRMDVLESAIRQEGER